MRGQLTLGRRRAVGGCGAVSSFNLDCATRELEEEERFVIDVFWIF